MSKVERIVWLINLLHHRRSITVREIQRQTGVSRRTAFRDLNTISEANIPVRFDETLRGYCLDRRDTFQVENLKTSDAILILVALLELADRVDESYQQDIQNLTRRIRSRLPADIDELWDWLLGRGQSHMDSAESTSPLLTSLLIDVAVLSRRGLRVVLSASDVRGQAVDLQSVQLMFDKEWRLHGSNGDSHHSIPVSQIRKVEVL